MPAARKHVLWRAAGCSSCSSSSRGNDAGATSCCSTLELRVSCSRGTRTGRPMAGGSRPWGVSSIDRPERREGMARHVYRRSLLKQRESDRVLPTRCAARLSHCVLVLPGHPRRAAHGRWSPAIGRVPQSTGPSGEKGNGTPRVPVATQERERLSVADETCCSTAALRVRAPGISTGQPMAGGSRPWGVSRNRPARAARKVMAPRVVPVAANSREGGSSTADVTCCSTAALRVRAPGH
jgi:hypothetical protein